MRVPGLSKAARRSPIVVAIASVALAVIFAIPSAPGTVVHSVLRTPTSVHAAPSRPTFAAHGLVRPLSLIGPFNGRYFNTSTTSPDGVSGYSYGVAVDPATQTVYQSLFYAGAVSKYSESTGALLNYAPVVDFLASYYVTGVAFDPVHHEVYVGVVAPGHGSVLVLNSTTLAVVANLTDPTYPTNTFEPVDALYDPASGNVYFGNESGGELVVVGTSGPSVLANIGCPVTGCQSAHITSVPRHHEIAAATGTGSVELYNSTTNTVDATLTVPGTGPYYTVGAAYDGSKDRLFFGNSSGAATVFFSFNASTHAFAGTIGGDPKFLQSLAADEQDHLLLATNSSPTSIVAVDEGTGSQTAVYSKSSAFPQIFIVQAVDSVTHHVIAAGIYNNSTYAFALPTLTPEIVYPSIPLEQVGVAVDSALGDYYVGSFISSKITAFSEASGAPLWTRYAPISVGLEEFAVDPVQGELYVPTIDGHIVVLNASTGALVTRIALTVTANATALAVDPVAHLLYAAESNQHVQVFSTTLHNALGNVATPGVSSCSGVADTGATHVAFFANCGTPGNVTTVSGLTYTKGAVYLAGNGTGRVVDDGNGFVYALNSGTENITKISVGLGAKVGTIGIRPTSATTISADGTDSLLLVGSVANESYELISTVSDSVVYTHRTGAAILASDFDAGSGTFVALEVFSGSVDLISRVATPSAPSGLVLTPTNDTIAATWSAPPSGGAAITGYTASIGTSSNGPWTNQSVTSPAATFSGLADGTKYYVQVTASNVVGSGPASPQANATPSGIPFPPTAVALSAVNSSSLGLSWGSPAATDGSPVVNYTIYWKATAASSWTSVNAGTVLAYSLSGLKASTNYSAYVVAWNAKGASNPSVTVELKTAAAPSKSSPNSLLGTGSWLLYAIIAVVVVAVIAAVVMVARRRKPPTGASAAPAGATLGPPASPPGGGPPTPWSEEPPSGPTPPSPP
ncbi:MAG TPA: fibronectin type III domain-containing protein [Thermoplasmata archaeon]|nr:fibronectin type III domain-containing protein [Thermoplasmata archaeon]